ncbi:hypothetical protein NPIL_495001 [Nephila pilipes]|uniref:Uncharacterized protein n=1 Tax=Nephila pilipes TaxID=299642 RepID=A0A8X6IQ04_NEPPI|nr:hypothetical protein NPIL_495001 [Nephila pilipes]
MVLNASEVMCRKLMVSILLYQSSRYFRRSLLMDDHWGSKYHWTKRRNTKALCSKTRVKQKTNHPRPEDSSLVNHFDSPEICRGGRETKSTGD